MVHNSNIYSDWKASLRREQIP